MPVRFRLVFPITFALTALFGLFALLPQPGVSVANEPPAPAQAAAPFPRVLPFGGGVFNTLTTADLNGDGALDLIGRNATGENWVYLNNGTGNFNWPGSARGFGTSTGRIIPADLNGDGFVDLVAQGKLYFNDGAGYFEWGDNPQLFVNAPLAVGDLNGDGALDIVAGGEPSMTVWLNNGTGLFINSEALGENAVDIVLGDLNGDHALDLAVMFLASALNTYQKAIYLNDGAGYFGWVGGEHRYPASPIQGNHFEMLEYVADATQDGLRDVWVKQIDVDAITVQFTYQCLVFANLGEGVLAEHPSWARCSSATSLADFNDDGAPDLVVGGGDGKPTRVLLNNGAGSFAEEGALVLPALANDARAVTTGDFNNDGQLDVVVATPSSNAVYLGAYKNLFSSTRYTDFTCDWGNLLVNAAAVGDVNNDGALDLVFDQTSMYPSTNCLPATGIAIRLNDGSGNFAWAGSERSTAPDFPQLTYPFLVWQIALGDVDGDGDLDLAATAPTTRSAVYLNDGRGVFTGTAGIRPLGVISGSLGAVTMADVNRDGALDVIASGGSYLDGYSSDPCWCYIFLSNTVYLNDGAGRFDWPGNQQYYGAGASETLVGDVNGDGAPDLVALGTLDQPNWLYLNDGAGHFAQSGQPLPLPAATPKEEPDHLGALGDINGDGALDLALNQVNQVYLNDGQGHFDASRSRPFGRAVTDRNLLADHVALADLNGDGALDVVAVNQDVVCGGMYCFIPTPSAVYLNDSAGYFDWPGSEHLIGDYGADGLALGDFNNDGAPDVFLSNFSDVFFPTARYAARVYFNQLNATPRRTNQPPRLSARRPGPQAPGYSVSPILGQPVIPITYTLFDREGDPAAVRAFYSLDGGGRWLPAVSASTTLTSALTTLRTVNTRVYRVIYPRLQNGSPENSWLFDGQTLVSLLEITNTANTVADVRVWLNFTHTLPTDLKIDLTAPSGHSVALVNQRGNGWPHTLTTLNPGDSIQRAIDIARPGDTIRLNSGVYEESVTLNKPISLTGVASDTVIWRGPDGQRPLTISGEQIDSSVVISGFTLTGGALQTLPAAPANLGGGLLISDSATPLISHLIISGNAAVSGGGVALFYVGREVQLTDVRFVNNYAAVSGGGLLSFDTPSDLARVTFEYNVSEQREGGGLFAGGPLTLTDAFFFRNRADSGGGLSSRNLLHINRSWFVENETLNTSFMGGRGGAVELSTFGSSVILPAVIAESVFERNVAATQGGALAVFLSTPVTLINSVVISNTAAGPGGGARIEGSLNAVNVLWQDNLAPSGAQVFVNGPVNLTHNTLVGSQVITTSAIWNDWGNLVLSNSIVASHTVGIDTYDFSTNEEDYNLFFDVGQAISGTSMSIITGGHSLHGLDPLFANPTAGDYHLTAASPARDAGTATDVTNDFEGDPRPQDGGPDMGFDEFSTAPAPNPFSPPSAPAATLASTPLTKIVFDSRAPRSIVTATLPFSGVYRPEGQLDSFDGENAAGVWRLKIEDLYVGEEGNLLAWGITVTLKSGVTHTFYWDTFASGVFGSSDNVVVRFEAQPVAPAQAARLTTTYRYTNAVSASPVHPVVAAETYPFRVRGAQVRVLSGTTPAENALVYRLPAGDATGIAHVIAEGGQAMRADAQGYLRGRGQLALGDRLVVLTPITATNNYSLYFTNAMPTLTGAQMYSVTKGGVQTITTSIANPLLLFNLDVSLEWDASRDTAYLNQLQFNLQRVSELLYDISDGQAALGQVNLYSNREQWDYAHVRVYANNRLRPYAAQGGIANEVITDPVTTTVPILYGPGQVSMAATWNRYGDPGATIGEDWPRTLAHELGHYLFFQSDNYIGLDAAQNGQLITVDCPNTIMGDAYRDDYSEFHRRDAEWDAQCASTLSARGTGRADWETITALFPWLHPPSMPNPGPNTLPLDLTHIEVKPLTNASTALADPRFYLVNASGARTQPSKQARAFLLKANNTLVDLGSPLVDQVLARGTTPGDTLCVLDPNSGLNGCKLLVDNTDQRLTLNADVTWQPDVRLTPITTLTLEVSVLNVPAGLTLTAQLFPLKSLTDTLPTPITLTTSVSGYSGLFHLSDVVLGGYVLVQAANDTQRVSLAEYSLGGAPAGRRDGFASRRDGFAGRRDGFAGRRDGFAPVLSSDGQVLLYTSELTFTEGTYYALQAATHLPNVPHWATTVGKGYWLFASGAITTLQNASLNMSYAQNDAPQGMEQWIKAYRYDPLTNTWSPLTSTVDADENQVTALIDEPGLYALMTTFEIPLAGSAWNSFAYPLAETRPVSEALLAIQGHYNLMYGYVPTDTVNPWRVYSPLPTTPSWVNDLTDLEFGKGYWLYMTDTATLRISPLVGPQAELIRPPATFYGAIQASTHFTPTAGMMMRAYMAGIECGSTVIRSVDNQWIYVIKVAADRAGQEGCGTPRGSVTFTIDGHWMGSVGQWDDRQINPMEIATDFRVYMPLLTR